MGPRRDTGRRFVHATRSAIGALSQVMISSLAGPTDTKGVFEASKVWMSHLGRFLSQIRAAIR